MTLVAAICLMGLVLAAAVLQSTTSGLPKRTGTPFISPPLFPPEIIETMKVPPFRPAGGLPPVAATNGDLPSFNQPLEAVQPYPSGAIAVHTLRFGSIPLRPRAHGLYTLPNATVQGRPDLGRPAKTWFDVARWRAEPALVAARQLSNGQLRVAVLAVRSGLPRLAGGVARTPRPRGTRTVAVATWDGSLPDLFVIDSGSTRVPFVVRIYSGESDFHKRLFAAALPLIGLSPKLASFDVVRLQAGGRADIVLVLRRGASGEPEFHVLTGSSFFSAFDQHLAVPARPLPAHVQLVVGTRLGQAAVYIVRLAGAVRTVRLLPVPYRVNVPS